MNKTQFILNIVTNIVAAIIIWSCVRLTRRAKSLFATGTIKARVRQIFTAKTIAILGSLAAAIFNLVILLRFVLGRSSFTRSDTFSAVAFSFIAAYWLSRLVREIGIVRELRDLQLHIAERERHRTLTAAQLSELTAKLRANLPAVRAVFEKPPHECVEIVYPTGDQEATEFAQALIRPLKEMEWPCGWRDATFPVHTVGLVFVVKNIDKQPLPLVILRRELALIGFDSELSRDNRLEERKGMLLVGSKY